MLSDDPFDPDHHMPGGRRRVRDARPRNLHGRVVEDLGRRIVSGEFLFDHNLNVVELSLEYDSGRGVIREALRALSSKGLVGARPKHGTYARPREAWNLLDPDVLRWQFEVMPSLQIIEQLAEVRVLVEPGAASLAAQRRTDLELDLIQSSLEAMAVSHHSPGDRVEAIAADVLFHTSILRATHNELIQQLVGVIEIGLRARDDVVYTSLQDHSNSHARHVAVAEAIRQRDSLTASTQMMVLVESAAADARDAVAKASTAPSERSP